LAAVFKRLPEFPATYEMVLVFLGKERGLALTSVASFGIFGEEKQIIGRRAMPFGTPWMECGIRKRRHRAGRGGIYMSHAW